MATHEPGGQPRVHPAVDRLASYSWRLLVIAAAGAAVLWLAGRIWPALLPVMIGVLLGRILWAPNTWLRERGLKPALAAAVTLLAFLALLSLALGLVSSAVA